MSELREWLSDPANIYLLKILGVLLVILAAVVAVSVIVMGGLGRL